MFPEGTRNFEGKAGAQAGVALLATLAGVPVLPAYIAGTDRAARLSRFTVTFGKPIAIGRNQKASRDELAKITDDIMTQIHALRETAGAD